MAGRSRRRRCHFHGLAVNLGLWSGGIQVEHPTWAPIFVLDSALALMRIIQRLGIMTLATVSARSLRARAT